MDAGMRLSLFFLFVLCVLLFGWYVMRMKREKDLLKSKVYAETVLEWEKLQAWFVRDFESDFKPFPLLLDTGGFVAREITVRSDKNGKLFIPSDLGPMEFIVAVRMLKKHFGVDF